MKIAIGIMLWNEETSVGMTIDSLFQQTIISNHNNRINSVDIIALANGCTDNSVAVAQSACSRNLEQCKLPYVRANVVELLIASKLNAWNTFVHDLTSHDVDYLILMDADIYLDKRDSLENMVFGLESHPECHVVSALGLKDTELKDQRSLLETLSLRLTRLEQNAQMTYVCGPLYGGRSKFFRTFKFPNGFVCGDDGFISTMATTNLLTTDHEFQRVYLAPKTTYVFEAYTGIITLFRQHVRREVGAVVRRMIVEHLMGIVRQKGSNAGEILLQKAKKDPDWLLRLQEKKFHELGFWVISPRRLKYRFTQLRGKSIGYKISKLPIVLLGTIWLGAVIIAANRKILHKEHLKVWLNNTNTRLVTDNK